MRAVVPIPYMKRGEGPSSILPDLGHFWEMVDDDDDDEGDWIDEGEDGDDDDDDWIDEDEEDLDNVQLN